MKRREAAITATVCSCWSRWLATAAYTHICVITTGSAADTDTPSAWTSNTGQRGFATSVIFYYNGTLCEAMPKDIIKIVSTKVHLKMQCINKNSIICKSKTSRADIISVQLILWMVSPTCQRFNCEIFQFSQYLLACPCRKARETVNKVRGCYTALIVAKKNRHSEQSIPELLHAYNNLLIAPITDSVVEHQVL